MQGCFSSTTVSNSNMEQKEDGAFLRASVTRVDKKAGACTDDGNDRDLYEIRVPSKSTRAMAMRRLMKGALGDPSGIMLATKPASALPGAAPARAKAAAAAPKRPMAEVCDEHGLESHDNEKGGALTAAHIKHLDPKTFANGLHKPNFHEDGMHKPMKSGDKEFETGFHYLLHCHELGGKNADGGYGGPLCKDPYGAEVRGIVDRLVKEADEDTTLAFNNFKDPCPQLTKEQVALCKGHDYGDKTLKLPMGPIPWPAGTPAPGYVPKSDPLHGRWITVSGGQKAFIKAAIEAGMLGKAEANKIQADTDHHQTGGMYLRINQHGETCTVDASVAKFARAKRTWKSGHYFYEPLVSGGNLLGVWVLPEEYRKIGFFWEMESGRCFRIERRAFPAGPYMFLRQATEVNGKISFVFYVKVDNDPGSSPIPVQSRDYTALAGCDNVCDNLGNPYPCTAKDLDYPIKRDTWLDQNEKEMLVQRKKVAATFAKISDQDFVGMGYTSRNIDGVTIDGIWEALVYKARNPQEVMDVSDVVVQDRKGFLWRSMYVKAQSKKVCEHIYCNERKGEIIYRVVDLETKRELDDERVIAIREEPLRMEFFHRHKSDGYRAYWAAPVKVVADIVEEVVKLAKKLELNNDVKVGLGVHSPVISGVSHDALWKSMVECVREPGRFIDGVKIVSLENKKGCVSRQISKGSRTFPKENIYVYESGCEIVYRVLDQWGKETDIERVVALRSHPLEIEFHARNRADGFRVDWTLPKENALSVVDAYVREAKRMDSAQPSIIGYGVSSDPISGVSYDSLFIAVERSIMDPGLVMPVEPSSVKIEENDGYVQRSFRLKRSGSYQSELVQEKISIFEEVGEVVFCKCDSSGRPGDNERVIAFHTGPLRMELYERDIRNDVRVSWKLPYSAATEYFTKVVGLAKKVEAAAKDVIGYGMASKPVAGMTEDTLWRAMLYSVRNPAQGGLDVSDVRITDMRGYLQRAMTLNYHPARPTITANIYPDERSREICYRKVHDGREEEDERVFALRNEGLGNVHMEMFTRHAKDRLRQHWKAPRTAVTQIFDGCVKLGQMMQNDPKRFETEYGARVNDNRNTTGGGYKGYAF